MADKTIHPLAFWADQGISAIKNLQCTILIALQETILGNK